MKNILFIFLVVAFTTSVFAKEREVAGIWQTVDDETKQVRSLVEISIENNKLYGKIIKIFPQQGELENPVCDKCTGDYKNRPILGLQIINGLSLKKNKWKNGDILDPNNGKTYDCKIWLEDGKLQVRGYIGFFFRTQEWIRSEKI